MGLNIKCRLSYSQKAKEIISKMSLEEKVYLMSGKVYIKQIAEDYINGGHYNHVPYAAGGNERLGVPEMLFCDGTRGAVQGNSTCFPVTAARGATFDIDLEERIGRAIGKEVRAHGGNLFAGVCINLPYNPGWGRSQETYGEESFHLGQMGSALVRGVQKENVIACVKHYAFNSMEFARFKVNVTADKRTAREVYLPHFRDCIDAGAASIMSSYNLYNGEHCGQNYYLLNEVLKKEWGFDGFVLSDFIWGITDTIKAANAGLDIEMFFAQYYGNNLIEAVREERVSESVVDEAAYRIVRTLLPLSEAEETRTYPESLIACKKHIALAQEVAEKSMTLIQNRNKVLPFSKDKVRKVVIVGRLGDAANTGDTGSSRVYPPYVVTPFEGIARLLPGCDVVLYNGEDVEHAARLAKSADVVILVLGYDHNDEGEYVGEEHTDIYLVGDRKDSLGLHPSETNIIKSIGTINPNTAVVLIGGGMIMIEEWKDYVPAILMAYYPGMEGGTAIARTLFGEVNPGGKLPFVIPKKESDLPKVDWETDQITYNYYHGYAKLEKEGIAHSLPYGFGLSYTAFSISNAKFDIKGKNIVAICDIENIGKCKGDEVVQMYVGFKNSSIDRPVKLLRGFKRVSLSPGEKINVKISCPVEKIKWYNPDTNSWELEHMEYEVYIGTSSAERDLIPGKIRL